MGYLGKTPLSRRDFGRVAATAAGLSLVPSLILVAAADQKSGGAEQETKPASQAPPAPSPEAQALAEIVKLRYGPRLDDAAMKEITRSLDGGLKSAAALRKVPLDNTEEPAFIFRAWRGDHA